MSGQPASPGCPGTELLKSYIDGETTGRERAGVESHLAGCARCGEEVRIMERIGEGVREMGRLETPPPGLRQRVLEQVAAGGERQPRREASWQPWIIGGLGVCVVAMVAAILFPVFARSREAARVGVQVPAASAPSIASPNTRATEQGIAPATPPTGGSAARMSQVPGYTGSGVTPDDIQRYVRGGESELNRRRVVQTADFEIRVKGSLESAEKSVTAKVTETGGYVESSSLSTRENGERRAMLTVRVPVASFEPTLGWLGSLGDVTAKNVRGEDVTGTWIDQRAEVREQREEETRLLRQLNAASSPSEREQARWALIRLRTAIRAAEERLAATAKMADLATLRITLTQPAGVSGAGLLGEMSETFTGAAAVFMLALRIPLTLAVWLLVFIPLWLPALLVYRWVRQQRA